MKKPTKNVLFSIIGTKYFLLLSLLNIFCEQFCLQTFYFEDTEFTYYGLDHLLTSSSTN